MSEQIPWTFTALGEDSFEEREACRRLHDHREARLFGQEIDARLIGFVWTVAPPLCDALIQADLTNVGWLDRLVVAQEGEDPESVPILSLEAENEGVVARDGALYLVDEHGFERPIELSEVFERVLGPGLASLDGLSAALCDELAALGGPALVAFAQKTAAKE
jgi:hypothetical protein